MIHNFGKAEKGGKRGRRNQRETKVVVAVSKARMVSPKYAKMQVVPDSRERLLVKFAKRLYRGRLCGAKQTPTVVTGKPLAEKYLHEISGFLNAESDMLKWLHTIIGNAKGFCLWHVSWVREKAYAKLP